MRYFGSGSEKGVFWKRGLFRKIHFLEILENLEILEFLENPQTVEKKGDSDHFLEILENLEILERDSSSEKTPFVMTPFSGPDWRSPNEFQKCGENLTKVSLPLHTFALGKQGQRVYIIGSERVCTIEALDPEKKRFPRWCCMLLFPSLMRTSYIQSA